MKRRGSGAASVEGAERKKGSKIPVRFAPVKAKIKQELRVLAREYSGQALETLVKICESGESETARVAVPTRCWIAVTANPPNTLTLP